MNITTAELQAIRATLSKDDKEDIAKQADKSFRTVEAVLQGNRTNDEIEKLCFKKARENWSKLGTIISKVEYKNLHETLLIEEYVKLKQNQVNSGEDYNHYMDVYLNLVHVDFKTEEELWEHLTQMYPAIISKSYWCITLFSRILGINEKRSVAFYNSKF